jgi:hypothetical protein
MADHAVWQRSGDSKIAEFDLGFPVDEDIWGFDISMDNISLMNELEVA